MGRGGRIHYWGNGLPPRIGGLARQIGGSTQDLCISLSHFPLAMRRTSTPLLALATAWPHSAVLITLLLTHTQTSDQNKKRKQNDGQTCLFAQSGHDDIRAYPKLESLWKDVVSFPKALPSLMRRVDMYHVSDSQALLAINGTNWTATHCSTWS